MDLRIVAARLPATLRSPFWMPIRYNRYPRGAARVVTALISRVSRQKLARGTQTQFSYGLVNGHEDLYVTQAKAAYQTSVQRTTDFQYDFYTGKSTLQTDITDIDNNVATSSVGETKAARTAALPCPCPLVR